MTRDVHAGWEALENMTGANRVRQISAWASFAAMARGQVLSVETRGVLLKAERSGVGCARPTGN